MSKKKESNSSLIPVGIVHLFGEDGVGKSTFPFTVPVSNYKKFVVLDDDSSKSRTLAAQTECVYHDLLEEAGDMDEVSFHKYVLDLVSGLPDDLDVIVFDNATRFFTGGHSYIVDNFDEYRKHKRGSGAIIGAYQWKALREHHLPRFYSLLSRKAKIVFIITHEKEQTDSSGIKTGAMEPAADKSLRKGANVTIRLTRNQSGSSVPTGLVIKDITKIPPVRVLPSRIEQCDWPTIMEYWESPVGLRDLRDDETPDEFEQSLITGSLTPEQKRVYELRMQLEMLQESQQMAEDVIAVASGMDFPLQIKAMNVVKELESAYPALTKDRVIQILQTATTAESNNGQ